MNATPDLVRGRLRKARSDLVAMKASREAGALDAACFHAQQAVEKALRAYLTHHDVEFPFTHNLSKLVRLASGCDESFGPLLPDVEPLTPYAVELRYDETFWPSEDAADEAAASAEKLTAFALARLPAQFASEAD